MWCGRRHRLHFSHSARRARVRSVHLPTADKVGRARHTVPCSSPQASQPTLTRLPGPSWTSARTGTATLSILALSAASASQFVHSGENDRWFRLKATTGPRRLHQLPGCQLLFDPTVDPTRLDFRRLPWTVTRSSELARDARRPLGTAPSGSEKPGVGGSIPPLGTSF